MLLNKDGKVNYSPVADDGHEVGENVVEGILADDREYNHDNDGEETVQVARDVLGKIAEHLHGDGDTV